MYYKLVVSILQMAGSFGAGCIVRDIVVATTPAVSGVLRNTCKTVASMAIAGILGTAVSNEIGRILLPKEKEKKAEVEGTPQPETPAEV